MKRLLITGGSGYLGRRLVEKARDAWAVLYTYHSHPVDLPGARGVPLDILDRDQVLRLFQEFRPHAVVHTAYTRENLETIVQGTRHVAWASAGVKARLLHLSTDAVFDGERGWYREDDAPAPIHLYGKAKFESEQLVAGHALLSETVGYKGRSPRLGRAALTERNAVIIRTSLIWGLNPMDVRTLRIRDCLEKGEKLVLFTDEYRCPIWVEELAAAVLELLGLNFCGIIHVAGPERMSRYEFGVKLARTLELDSSGIIPGLSHESGLVRPRDCSLDISLAKSILQTRISSASDLLASACQAQGEMS